MFDEILVVGMVVLIECPGRYFFGRVESRTAMDVTIGEAGVAHDISDLSEFLHGRLAAGCEITVLPRPRVISFAAIEGVDSLPDDSLKTLRVNTHSATGNQRG